MRRLKCRSGLSDSETVFARSTWLAVALLLSTAALTRQVVAPAGPGQGADTHTQQRIERLLVELEQHGAPSQTLAALRHELVSRPAAGTDVVPVDLVPLLCALLAFGMVLIAWRAREGRPSRRVFDDATAPATTAGIDQRLTYLANVSHEIRTPINTILGYTDVLCNDDPSAAEHVEYLETIRRNGDHLLAIVGDILDLSRLESGQLSAERIYCRLPELLHEVTALVRPEAELNGLGFEVVHRGALPEHVHTDPVRLRQILLNLLTNAVKFTEVGDIELAVGVENGEAGEPARLVFVVSDTGIGIDPAQLESLFDPFVQVPGAAPGAGGSGLGLTISRSFARMLGGDVSAESAPNVGSAFTVWIDPGPLDGESMLDGEAALAVQPATVTDVERVRVSGRVLLVEDGPDTQRLVAHFLRHAGARVWVASDGREGSDMAIEAVRSGAAFDLVLMDIEMPEMNGYDATRRVRDAGVNTPIVALTAYAGADEQQAALDAGCDEVVAKPVPRAVLLEVVQRHLNGGREALGEPVASMGEMLGSPELDTLTRMFVDLLEERVAEMEQAVGGDEGVQLQRLAHRLKGAAGSYGFLGISEAAAAVEAAARNGENTQACLESLARLCHQTRVSYPGAGSPAGSA